MQCAILKKSRFIKKQEASGLLSSLGLKTPLIKVLPLGDIYFWWYKRNKIINKFLLPGNMLIPEMHLRQPEFTYSACGPFTINK